MTAPTPRTPCASLFFSETQGRNNLSSQWCSDAIHSGCNLAGLSRRDRRLRFSEQGRHHGQVLDVENLGTRRFCDCRRLLPRDAERLDRRGVRERIVSPNHGAPTTLTLIRADRDVRTG